ncbi:MAG: ROK family transcriptional regulator [Alicyclobacillus sp.]|nr:ROK family transcriptional regulator [Alicyclobacillus sp.]
MDVRNHTELRDYNTALIFRTIHRQGPLSRTDIAEQTGLSASTVTVITGELQSRGLIRECGFAQSRGGRRPVLMECNPGGGGFLCADLSGERLRVTVVNLAMEVVHHVPVSSVRIRGERLLYVLLNALSDARKWCSETGLPVLAAGIASPGLMSEGRVVQADNLDWYDFDLKGVLEGALGIPVRVENDSNAAAYGEYQYGLGRIVGSKVMLFAIADAGIGSGLVIQDGLYTGTAGMAGELGHVKVLPDGPLCTCGGRGCLEAVASAPAIQRAYQRETGQWLDLASVCERAQLGDECASLVLRRAARWLGQAIGNQVNMLNVDCVVLGGCVALTSPLFFSAVVEAARESALPALAHRFSVHEAALGEQAGAIGVASLCLNELLTGAAV